MTIFTQNLLLSNFLSLIDKYSVKLVKAWTFAENDVFLNQQLFISLMPKRATHCFLHR